MELNKYEIRRTDTKMIEHEDKIRSSSDAIKIIKEFVEKDLLEVQESFWTLFLNRSNKVIGYTELSRGGLAGTVVDLKLLAFQAVNLLASSIIMIHNHPSGNLEPSIQDKKITEKAKEALKLLDIEVLDHIIINTNDHYSFINNGIL